jgi:hypothetical protein
MSSIATTEGKVVAAVAAATVLEQLSVVANI